MDLSVVLVFFLQYPMSLFGFTGSFYLNDTAYSKNVIKSVKFSICVYFITK